MKKSVKLKINGHKVILNFANNPKSKKVLNQVKTTLAKSILKDEKKAS